MRQLQVFVQSKKGKSKIQKENPAIPRPRLSIPCTSSEFDQVIQNCLCRDVCRTNPSRTSDSPTPTSDLAKMLKFYPGGGQKLIVVARGKVAAKAQPSSSSSSSSSKASSTSAQRSKNSLLHKRTRPEGQYCSGRTGIIRLREKSKQDALREEIQKHMVDENWIPNRQAPHQWISTGALNRIVQLCPRRVADLEYFKSVGLREKSKKRFGNKLVQLINRFLRANRITLEGNFPSLRFPTHREELYRQ